jgi:signal transduction histidine kinase
VTPTKQRFLWFFTIMAINLGLHAIEFYHPEWIKYQYHDRSSLTLDFSFAFGIVASIIFITINYLRRNYNIEKQFSEESARALKLQYQQITEQKVQLERSSSEKDKLMSIIAHDLRAPLGNIQNYLKLIAEYDIGSDGRKIVEADLLKATQNTMAMLSKLLLWSKAQMDGVTVNLEKINLAETINAPLEIERSLASNKQINLLCHIDPAITLLADTDMLQLVLRNLVNNAIKFTPPGGTITVEASKTASACRMSVTDTGIGIPYDQQSSLFSLRVRSTYGTANEKGVGLGLLLCKEFTELQGGILGFNSTPGQGSTFFMEFALSE